MSRRHALIAVALAVALSGCRLSGTVGRAAGAVFTPTEKVAKTKEPFRKDVRLSVLWIGHATALIQLDDKLILTDPVFTSSVGQFASRIVEPGLDPADLPPVDAVLISHMHPDHLSLGSIDTIEKKVRTMLMPPGGTAYLTDFGFPVYELRTWQAWEKSGLRVTAVPVKHVGWRYGVDEAWMPPAFTGYVVEYHGMKVYFGGDTAYDQKLFVETAQRFSDIDVALLPIAPIEPRSMMRRGHMDAFEALQSFVDLKAVRMVPIHYDTFVSTDLVGEPLAALSAAETKVVHDRLRPIVRLRIGEQRVFVKQGEDPAALRPKPAAPPPADPTPLPGKKNEISDDDRLD